MKKENYKKIIKYLLIVVLLLTTVFLLYNSPVFADVGNNNDYSDYDYGGYSDYGDFDSGSSSSSDADAGDILLLFYILVDTFGPIGTLVIIALIIGVSIYLKKSGRLKQMRVMNANQNALRRAHESENIPDSNLSHSIAQNIRNVDPNFSEDDFIGWAREVFMKIQQAWTDRNWKIIRPFESQELFNQHNQQLDEYIKNNKINKVEKIAIRHCSLRDYHVDGDKEVLVVELHATMHDYVVDANTNEVLESDPNRTWFMKYEMTFNRKKGVLTKMGMSNKSTTNCPNCGAPTEITSAGQCEYCKSIITTGEHDWVLSNIVSIK